MDTPRIVLGAMWRQGSDLLPQDQTLAGLITDLQAGGLTLAIADAAQGATMQGAFSHTAIDVETPGEVAALAVALDRAGITFWPMTNFLGIDPGAEASLHGQLVRAVSTAIGRRVALVVDFERYPGFYDAKRPESAAQMYFSNLDTAGNALVCCIDPREPGRDYALSLLPESAPLLLQTYDKDFQQPLDAVFAKYLDPALWPGRTIWPMVQGDDPTATIKQAAGLVAGKFGLLVVWGFGSLVGTPDPNDVDDLSTLKAFAAPWTDPLPGTHGPVTPEPPRDETWAALDALQVLADKWTVDGWPSAGAGIRSGAETIKSLVRATKLER